MPYTNDITIVLRPLKDNVPVEARLRALLKTALRRDKFRAVRIDDGQPSQAREDATSDPDAPSVQRRG